MDLPRYAHTFNRGLDKRVIFLENSYYERFLLCTMLSRLSKAPGATIFLKQQDLKILPPESKFEEIWGPPLVNILSYCLMPNHFHFLLKELIPRGISKFMTRLGDAYTKYFNARNEREGRLFTGSYKQVGIENNEQLIHTDRYIHINPSTSSHTKVPIKQLPNYPWSSLPSYLRQKRDLLVQPEEVLAFFQSPKDYWDFISKGLEDSLDRFAPNIFIDAEEIYL